MKPNFSIITLYSYGMCNLNCRYCTIDKNPALKEVDDYLKKSFENSDSYFQRILKYCPDPKQIKKVETWGGEPSFGWYRIYPLLDKIIQHYPLFSKFFSSTNFSYPNWPENVIQLLDFFAQYPLRHFDIELQLSCDGPTAINDANRGNGVTQRCLNNLNKLLEILKTKDYKNIQIIMFTKPTLDINNIRLLQDKESIIDYYNFLDENFIEKINNFNIPFVRTSFSVPNIAVPTPATKKDGEMFGHMVKLCLEIEKEADKYFKNYRGTTPFFSGAFKNPCTPNSQTADCGTGHFVLELLPDNLYGTCHMAFSDIAENYKKLKQHETSNKTINIKAYLESADTPFVLNEKEYDEFIDMIYYQSCTGSTARLIEMINTIYALALAEQIDSKYKEPKYAFEAASYLLDVLPFCIYENRVIAGSMLLTDVGMYKQLLNGALDYLKESFSDGK